MEDQTIRLKGHLSKLSKRALLNRARLVKLRRLYGFPNQSSLARHLGVATSTISRAEKWGLVTAGLELKILDKFGIRLEEISDANIKALDEEGE